MAYGWWFDSGAFSSFPEGCYIDSIQYGGKDVPQSGIEYVAGAALDITIASDGATVDGKRREVVARRHRLRFAPGDRAGAEGLIRYVLPL